MSAEKPVEKAADATNVQEKTTIEGDVTLYCLKCKKFQECDHISLKKVTFESKKKHTPMCRNTISAKCKVCGCPVRRFIKLTDSSTKSHGKEEQL